MSDHLDGIEFGQVWRNRKSGKEVTVIGIERSQVDVRISQPGRAAKWIYAYNLKRLYTLTPSQRPTNPDQ